jgi:hypothetical protein
MIGVSNEDVVNMAQGFLEAVDVGDETLVNAIVKCGLWTGANAAIIDVGKMLIGMSMKYKDEMSLILATGAIVVLFDTI